MKKLLILFVTIAFFSCNNTNPTKTSSDFKYEGNEVRFFTNDSLITDSAIKNIKNRALLEAKQTCKYPESFMPTRLNISRVDSTRIDDLSELVQGDIAFFVTTYFNAKNSFGTYGRENLNFYYSENGKYLGKLPNIDLD